MLDRHLTAPPASPADGDRYIVAPGAIGAWAGWDLNVAYYIDGAWMRLVPRPGWRAWVVANEASSLAWNGSAWVAAGLPAFSDAVFELTHDGDPTWRAVFDLAAITAGPLRSFALHDISTELAGLSGAQTFDGDKTFARVLEASGAFWDSTSRYRRRERLFSWYRVRLGYCGNGFSPSDEPPRHRAPSASTRKGKSPASGGQRGGSWGRQALKICVAAGPRLR